MRINNILWLFPFISFIGGYFAIERFYSIKEIETPHLLGKNIDQAFKMLSDLNLNCRLLGTKEDQTLPPGTIISQTPTNGQKIKQNQIVFLVISSAPQKIMAPSFVGKIKESILEDTSKLNLKTKIFYLQSNYPLNTCFAQNPDPGEVLENKKIILYLSSGKNNQMLMPNLKGKLVADIKEKLSQNSIQIEIAHTPKQELSHICKDCIIIDQRPLAGSIIELQNDKAFSVYVLAKNPNG